jgi:hypothetical protein
MTAAFESSSSSRVDQVVPVTVDAVINAMSGLVGPIASIALIGSLRGANVGRAGPWLRGVLGRLLHEKPQGLVIMPLIATAAPLVTCRLNSDGEVVLEQVHYLHVWGHDYAGQRRRVYVLAEPRLPRFAAALAQLAQAANTTGT